MIFPWTLYDEVEIPESLAPGDYVLSFRWDTEQTPQVFNSCADIVIVKLRVRVRVKVKVKSQT